MTNAAEPPKPLANAPMPAQGVKQSETEAKAPLPTSAPSTAPSPATTSSTPAPFRLYRNADMYGGDLPLLRDVDDASCANACRTDAHCVAYSYDTWKRACYPKSTINELLTDARSITAVRTDVTAPGSSQKPIIFETFHNQAFPAQADAASKPAHSFEECQALCGRSTSCVALTYVGARHSCLPLNETQKYLPSPGSESAAKRQYSDQEEG